VPLLPSQQLQEGLQLLELLLRLQVLCWLLQGKACLPCVKSVQLLHAPMCPPGMLAGCLQQR
jgi:hypothetical protein